MRGRQITLTFFVATAISLLMLANVAIACIPPQAVRIGNPRPTWAHVDNPCGLWLSSAQGTAWRWSCSGGSLQVPSEGYSFCVDPSGHYHGYDPPQETTLTCPSVGSYSAEIWAGDGSGTWGWLGENVGDDYVVVYAVEVGLSASNTNLEVNGSRHPITLSASAPDSGHDGCKVRLSLNCSYADWANIYTSQTGGECLIWGNDYVEWPYGQQPPQVWIEGENYSPVNGVDVWIQYIDPYGDYHQPLYPLGESQLTFTVYQVELVPSQTGTNPSLDYPGDICLNAQDEYQKTLWTAYVWPEGTASVTVVPSSSAHDVYLEGIGGANLSALTSGQQFWVTGGALVGHYTLQLEHNAVEAYYYAGADVFEFAVQEGTLGSLYLDLASYGTWSNYDYNPSGGNYSNQPTTYVPRDFWVDTVGADYSGKVKLTATYKAGGMVIAQAKKSGWAGPPVSGISFGIPGLTSTVSLPNVTGGVRAAAGMGIHVPRDDGNGYWENIYKVWTTDLSWPWLLYDGEGGGPLYTAESPPYDNTFSSVGISAKKSITLSTFLDVSVNSADFNKGQAVVSGVQDVISNQTFTILPP